MNTVQRESVGARVKALRLDRGWSQKRLGKEASVSENTVIAIEKGTKKTQPEKLRAVLDTLGVPLQQDDDQIVIQGMPEDIAVFLRVAAQRLSVLDPDRRARLLSEIYPRLLTD